MVLQFFLQQVTVEKSYENISTKLDETKKRLMHEQFEKILAHKHLSTNVYEIIDNGIVVVESYNQVPNDFRNSSPNITTTLNNQINVYDNDFFITNQINKTDYEDINQLTQFIATETIGDFIYIATNNSGVIEFNINDFFLLDFIINNFG